MALSAATSISPKPEFVSESEWTRAHSREEFMTVMAKLFEVSHAKMRGFLDRRPARGDTICTRLALRNDQVVSAFRFVYGAHERQVHVQPMVLALTSRHRMPGLEETLVEELERQLQFAYDACPGHPLFISGLWVNRDQRPLRHVLIRRGWKRWQEGDHCPITPFFGIGPAFWATPNVDLPVDP